MSTRSRSGCKTCRTRKLKCDETKPICGQCRKSNRECIPSEGIAFRHAQNAGFSGAGGKDLANFYKYRQKFENTYFLPVPKELSFIHITDPYAHDNPADSHAQAMHISQAPPLPHLPQDSSYGPDYTLAGIEDHVNVDTQYVDVAASSLKAMIDPNLEADTQGGIRTEHHPPDQSGYAENHPDSFANTTADGQFLKNDDSLQDENINETIMKALQNTQEQVKSM